jgi:hypothetical protein
VTIRVALTGSMNFIAAGIINNQFCNQSALNVGHMKFALPKIFFQFLRFGSVGGASAVGHYGFPIGKTG